MVQALMRIIRFYAHESCGWCIPCREGTAWLRKLLIRFHEGGGARRDIDLIADLGVPVLMDFPAGHDSPNLTLPLGTEVELVVEETTGWIVYREDALAEASTPPPAI